MMYQFSQNSVLEKIRQGKEKINIGERTIRKEDQIHKPRQRHIIYNMNIE